MYGVLVYPYQSSNKIFDQSLIDRFNTLLRSPHCVGVCYFEGGSFEETPQHSPVSQCRVLPKVLVLRRALTRSLSQQRMLFGCSTCCTLTSPNTTWPTGNVGLCVICANFFFCCAFLVLLTPHAYSPGFLQMAHTFSIPTICIWYLSATPGSPGLLCFSLQLPIASLTLAKP
jgi:hypothetical protein